MNAAIFWEIIGHYNQQTKEIQAALTVLIALSLVLAKYGRIWWLPKITLGISNIYVGIVFFLIFGTQPIQFFFAAPLFIAAGALFILEALGVNRADKISRFNAVQWTLFGGVLFYPFLSMLLGNRFPEMVVYIMPCPIISFSIVIYSGYKQKNRALLTLLALWGLTGIKSFFFNALEDTILLLCGIYCLWILVRNKESGKKDTPSSWTSKIK